MFQPQPKPQKEEKPVAKRVLRMTKCRVCKDKFRPRFQNQKFCMEKDDCIRGHVEYAKELIRKKENREWRNRKKELKEKQKTISGWKDDLQLVINWIVREIDKNLSCISHPDMKDFLRYDAGHAWTVKAHSDIRFNLHNIHKQNSQANDRYGYCAEYQRGLRNRYGEEYLEMVEGLPLKWKGTAKEHFTIPKIREAYLPKASEIQRRIKKGELFTRDEVNEMIGIYI